MSSEDVYVLVNNLNTTIMYLYKYVLLIIYIFGNLGNFLSFLLLMKKSWKKNVCILYFKCLLISKTCYLNCSILGLILINGYHSSFANTNNFTCKTYLYFSFVFVTISPTVLILASVDRLLISSQNTDTRLYSSKRMAYVLISVCTIFWTLFNIHILIKVYIQQPNPFLKFCYYEYTSNYLNFVSISTTVIHVIFFLLMTSLCLLSFKNVRKIRTFPSHQSPGTRSMTKKDFQLLRCLFAQDLVFILFGMLCILLYVYSLITKDQHRNLLRFTIESFLQLLFDLLYAVPFAADFFIFILVSKSFRHECKRIIFKILRKQVQPLRENENKNIQN